MEGKLPEKKQESFQEDKGVLLCWKKYTEGGPASGAGDGWKDRRI